MTADLGLKRTRRGWDALRVELSDQAARLDDALTLNLAIHYGHGPEHILSLLQDVFWRLPIEVRMNLLRDALWRTGLHDEVPFLEPSLRTVFRTRHLLAHSVTYGENEKCLTLRTVKRGTPEITELHRETLTWAIRTADRCATSFLRIEGRIGDTEVWGELYGFPDRARA